MQKFEPVFMQGNKKGNKSTEKTEIHKFIQDIPWNGCKDSSIKITGNKENNSIRPITVISITNNESK